jgi:hypothetical protein
VFGENWKQKKNRYNITSQNIGNYIQFKRDHAIIGNFMGIWPLEMALITWFNTHWKPNGQIDLKLGSERFFIVIFRYTKDRERIFEEGPYFFNSVGLHMKYWIERFSLEREEFTKTPVWISMYSLP